MSKLKKWLYLSDKGWRDLKKAIWACTLTNFALMLPVVVSVQIFIEILQPFLHDTPVDWCKMWLLFGLGIVAAVIIYICSRNDYRKTYIASYKESGQTRKDIAEHVRKLPMSFFNKKNLSEVTTNIMADCSTSEQVLSHIIPQLISNFISLSTVCVLLAIFDWRMAVAVFCTLPISLVVVLASRKIQMKFGGKHLAEQLVAINQIQEYLEGIKVIKAFGLTGKRFASLDKALIEVKKAAIKMELVISILVMGANVILQSGIGITLYLGVNLLSGGGIDFVTFLIFALVVFRVYGPIVVELTLLAELFYMQLAVKRMRKLKETPIMGGSQKTRLSNFDIEFRQVSFGYGDAAVIDEISLKIPTKSITAIVGASGSGKTTICRLIARFWDVQKGTVTIGGKDIKQIHPEHLMEYISFVFQDVTLFNDTVFNNIKIGKETATRKQVLRAAKLARCDEFIENLPDGYDTLLGENGCRLSGGERQRLSIARALLKDAPIVLLDEATAALDPENELYIQEAISKLVKDKTVVIIAHRLRTVVGVDKIVVLEGGRVVEEGVHEQLLCRAGVYSKLYNLQQQSEGWKISAG
jgi:ATP-binding cassette subfamily B protein